MSLTPATGIITPEAVVLEFRPAGLATRAIAKVVDLLVQGVMTVIIVVIAGFAFGGAGSSVGATVLVTLGMFFVFIFAPALMETFWNGRTPGKMALHLRVLTIDGGPISFRHALVRNLIALMELPLGVAIFVALGNPRSQRLGDLAAGTFVVNERSERVSIIPTRFVAPPGLEWYCAQLDVSRVDSEQFLLARNYLLRVNELAARPRYDLAVRLATRFADRCTPAPPPHIPPEYYLICICAAYQVRHHHDDDDLVRVGAR